MVISLESLVIWLNIISISFGFFGALLIAIPLYIKHTKAVDAATPQFDPEVSVWGSNVPQFTPNTALVRHLDRGRHYLKSGLALFVIGVVVQLSTVVAQFWLK